jgi:serine/threonine protein kinase
MASSSSNVVGVHYRVGKKIGEGSFGVIFEGTNLLNSQSVAIKFVRAKQVTLNCPPPGRPSYRLDWNPPANNRCRSLARAMHLNFEMSTERTRFLWAAVSLSPLLPLAACRNKKY